MFDLTPTLVKIYFYLFSSVCFFLLSPIDLIAQSTSDVQWISRDTTVGRVNVIANWKKGEKKKYRASKTTKKFVEDSLLTKKVELDQIVEFAVVDSTADSYELSYHIRENMRDISNDPVIPFEKLGIADQDMVLHYQTRPEGDLRKYHNREAVEKAMDEMIKLVVKDRKASFEPKDEAEKQVFDAVFAKTANGKVLFSTVYEVFVSQFHNFHGYGSGLNDTLRYTETWPNSFGSTPINYDCYLYISSLDSLNEVRFDIEKFAEMNGVLKDFSGFMKKNQEAAGVKANDDMERGFAKLDMKMEMYVTTFIDLHTGWPTFIKVTKSVISKDEKINKTHFQDEIWVLTDDLSDQ
jgi:hypothetical protein